MPKCVIGPGGFTATSDLVDVCVYVCHRGHYEGLSMQMSACG